MHPFYVDPELDMQISKWGNSLAIRLPASVVQVLQLREGDDVEVLVAGERTLELSRKPGRRELLARVRRMRGKLPSDLKFVRDEANDRS